MGQPIGGGADTANPLVVGTFTAAGDSAAAVFYGRFNVSLWGTFAGTVQLQRSFDGGTTWLPVSYPLTGDALSWTAAVSTTVEEPEHLVAYRLACTVYTSGTVNYRLSQSSDFLFSGGVSR